jgi:hypothetical protein
MTEGLTLKGQQNRRFLTDERFMGSLWEDRHPEIEAVDGIKSIPARRSKPTDCSENDGQQPPSDADESRRNQGRRGSHCSITVILRTVAEASPEAIEESVRADAVRTSGIDASASPTPAGAGGPGQKISRDGRSAGASIQKVNQTSLVRVTP